MNTYIIENTYDERLTKVEAENVNECIKKLYNGCNSHLPLTFEQFSKALIGFKDDIEGMVELFNSIVDDESDYIDAIYILGEILGEKIY